MKSLISALILTIFIEGIVMLIMTRSWKWLFFNNLVNALTNPVLNLTLMWAVFFGAGRPLRITILLAGEVLVFVTEAFIYRLLTEEEAGKCRKRSLVTNLASFCAGILFYLIIN